MVEIEMGEHDVAHVGGREAERLDLADRGLLLAQLDVEHRAHRAGDARLGRPMRVVDVLEAVAGVDEDEAAVGLDQQAVADEMALEALAAPVEQPAAERAIGAAIEMMDAHARSSMVAR